MRFAPRPARRARLVALCIALVLGFAGVFQHGLWTPDEPREAEIGREMLESGFSALPTLGNEPFVEKPPLHPWLMAGGFALFGVSAGVARLPAVLFGIGAVLVAFELGRRAGGRTAGLLAAIVLATTAKFAEASHSAINDNAVVFFVAAGHLAILRERDRWREGRSGWGFALAGALAGLAFLTKSFIGPVLLAGPPLLAAVTLREGAFVRRALPRLFGWCVLGVALLGVPWVLALARVAGWEQVRVCLVDNTIGRAMGGHEYAAFGHARGPFDYLVSFPAGFLPWSLAIPAVIVAGVVATRRRNRNAGFLAWTVIAGLVLLSIPSGKRDLYALPLYPAAAAVIGVWLAHASGRRFGRVTRFVLQLLPALAWMAVAAGALFVSLDLGTSWDEHDALYPIVQSCGVDLLRLVAVLLAVGGLALLVSAIRGRANPAAALVAFVLVFHLVLRPLIDPLKNMRPNATELARRIPGDEPILALAADETTRAVVPFYTGRFVRSVPDSDAALAALAAGPARHLVVQGSAEAKLSAAARAKLGIVWTISISSTRPVNVYEYEGSR